MTDLEFDAEQMRLDCQAIRKQVKKYKRKRDREKGRRK